MSSSELEFLLPERDTQASLHHANEWMKCPTCAVAWPCEPFLEARLRDRVPLVVYPERRPGEAAGHGTRSPAIRSGAGNAGPRST